MNNWIETALQILAKSLNPVPVELNELDWKSGLSDKSERLAQHISAFASGGDTRREGEMYIEVIKYSTLLEKAISLNKIFTDKIV